MVKMRMTEAGWRKQEGRDKGLEAKPRSWLYLGGHGDGNDHSNRGHHDSQGSAARAVATREATKPSTVVTKAGTATLDGWVQETINATIIRRSRRLFSS